MHHWRLPKPLDVLNAMAVYSRVWQGRSYLRPKPGEKRRFNPCWMNHASLRIAYLEIAPSQWVLGKTPREAPSLVSEDQFADLGAIEDQVDPESRFAFQHQARLEAKKAFVHLDTSKRVQRALLRSAKPIPQTYSVGDVVCFRREPAR